MAFGDSATLLDDFTRADETPLGGNWSPMDVSGGDGTFNLASNVITQNQGGVCRSYWNVEQFGPDVEVYVQVAAASSQNTRIATVDLRLQNPDTAAIDGYEVGIRHNGRVEVYRFDNSTPTRIDAGAWDIGTLSTGDWFGASMIGDTITIYYSTDGSTWTEVGSVVDSTYSAGGYVAVAGNGSTSLYSFDNFHAGTISSGQTITGAQTLNAAGSTTLGGTIASEQPLTGGSGIASGASVTAGGTVTEIQHITGGSTLAAGGSVGAGGSIGTPLVISGSTPLDAGGSVTAGGSLASELALVGSTGISTGSGVTGGGSIATIGPQDITGGVTVSAGGSVISGGSIDTPSEAEIRARKRMDLYWIKRSGFDLWH